MRRAYATKEAIMSVYSEKLVAYILYMYTPEEFMNFVKPVLNGTIEFQLEQSKNRGEEVYYLTIPDADRDIQEYTRLLGDHNFRALKD